MASGVSGAGRGIPERRRTPQKWMNFYTKVLSRFARDSGLKLTVGVEVSPEGGVSEQSVEETKVALRELGLKDDVKTS